MSYQYKRADVQVVVCDICDDFSWVGDRDWRAMPQSTPERAIHLCASCQSVAMWCVAHEQYHRADAFHRCPCVDCGGLYTSVVREKITRCPSCRRLARDYPTHVAPPYQERPRSLIQKLFLLGATHRQ